MEFENEKRKDGLYNTWCFYVFSIFHPPNEKTEIGITVFRLLGD